MCFSRHRAETCRLQVKACGTAQVALFFWEGDLSTFTCSLFFPHWKMSRQNKALGATVLTEYHHSLESYFTSTSLSICLHGWCWRHVLVWRFWIWCWATFLRRGGGHSPSPGWVLSFMMQELWLMGGQPATCHRLYRLQHPLQPFPPHLEGWGLRLGRRTLVFWCRCGLRDWCRKKMFHFL